MAKIEQNPWYFNDKNREQQEEDHRTLLAMRFELEDLPTEGVHRPLGNVHTFIEEGRALAREAHAAGRCSDEQLANIERLSRALRGAQLAHLFKPHPRRADPGLACFLDSQLNLIEGDAGALVREGRFELEELPRAASSSTRDRFARGLALVAFFRERRLPSRASLEKLAEHLPKSAPTMGETRSEVAITALRDRAYSALRTAVAELSRPELASGTYPLTGLCPVELPGRAA